MLIEKFKIYLAAERRLSIHTVTAYVDDIESFKLYLNTEFELHNLNEVNFAQIRSWIAFLMDKGLTGRSVNRKISSVKSFYKLLKREGIILENPTGKIVKPKTSKRLPVFVEQENINNLFDIVEFDDSFSSIRDKLVLNMFYVTGIRLSELINLKTKDIDLYLQQIKVLGKRNKERIVPINSELHNLINSYVSYKDIESIKTDWFFVTNKGDKFYEKFVYRLVNYYLSKVSTVTKKSPHVLRHTFATHMLNNGAELNAIKELLGHANLSATEVYTHNTFEKLKNIYKQAHPRA